MRWSFWIGTNSCWYRIFSFKLFAWFATDTFFITFCPGCCWIALDSQLTEELPRLAAVGKCIVTRAVVGLLDLEYRFTKTALEKMQAIQFDKQALRQDIVGECLSLQRKALIDMFGLRILPRSVAKEFELPTDIAILQQPSRRVNFLSACLIALTFCHRLPVEVWCHNFCLLLFWQHRTSSVIVCFVLNCLHVLLWAEIACVWSSFDCLIAYIFLVLLTWLMNMDYFCYCIVQKLRESIGENFTFSNKDLVESDASVHYKPSSYFSGPNDEAVVIYDFEAADTGELTVCYCVLYIHFFNLGYYA